MRVKDVYETVKKGKERMEKAKDKEFLENGESKRHAWYKGAIHALNDVLGHIRGEIGAI